MDFDFDRIHHGLGTMKGEPTNESKKKRDRLSPGYIKKLLGPMRKEMRAKHREFLQVSGRRFHDSKKRAVAKTQPSSFGILSAPKAIHQPEKERLGQPRAARSLESPVPLTAPITSNPDNWRDGRAAPPANVDRTDQFPPVPHSLLRTSQARCSHTPRADAVDHVQPGIAQ